MRRYGGRRRALIAGAVLMVVLGAVAAGYGFGGPPSSDTAAEAPVKTVEVSRMTLVDYVDVPGEIGAGEVLPLRYVPPPAAEPPASGPPEAGAASPAPTGQPETGSPVDDGLGLVTWLPAVGSTVERGKPLLRIDNRPVVLLFGPLPLYRTLKPGTKGPDVRQLEDNLRELDLTGFTVDEQYTDATATAVRRWQKSIGVPQTGVVSPGRVIYSDGPARVAEQRVRVGDVATGDILGYTGTVPSVTGQVDLSKLGRPVATGMRVTVVAPDGSEAAGTVRRVAKPPPSEGAPPDAGLTVEVQVEIPQQFVKDRQGAVTIRFLANERKDVLAVPVIALVALAEGGYGLQVADGPTPLYVPVRTGLFARGFVEIESGAVDEHTKVVVP